MAYGPGGSLSILILFGLPGVKVSRVERGADEEGGRVRLVHVVTTERAAAACPKRGVFSASVKQYRTTRPRDLTYGGGAAAGALA